MRIASLALVAVLCVVVSSFVQAQQFADPEFNAKVEHPAYSGSHPAVLFDEAHNNFHTTDGRYKPFVDMIRNDGYAVTPNTKKLNPGAFKGQQILVIVNAQGAPAMRNPNAARPAFDASECTAVRDWVHGGGSLLLIADHHPWGASNESLAAALGVEMGKSTSFDPVNSENGAPGLLIFSRENNLIGDHPILTGRNGSERIDRVLSFTGQSLKGPANATSLLKFSRTAVDLPKPAVPGRNGSAEGRAQGIAFTLGKGRVVVLGEAAMLTAQLNGRFGRPVGMNVPGTENRQLALNIMHWLSSLRGMDDIGLAVRTPVSPKNAAASPKAGSSPAPSPSTSLEGASASGNTQTSPAMEKPTAVASPSPPSVNPGRPLSPAEIAEESEASIALVSGANGSGTGFLLRPGLLVTNSHVIDQEYMSDVRVRFPSAEKAEQGPIPAQLVYENPRRDLAFLRVKSKLKPLRIAVSYKFRKGEDITVIGNPGAGEELVLENAINRGVISTKTTLDRERFYQLGIAVNPGNSGGPVFDSTGQVIGVVARKSIEQEQLAYCIPVEDLNLAIDKVTTMPEDMLPREQSQHRLRVAAKDLGNGAVLYSLGIALHRQAGSNTGQPKNVSAYYDSAIARLERQKLPKLRAELTKTREDPLVSPPIREKIGQLVDNLDKLRMLYVEKKPAPAAGDPLDGLKKTHRRLLVEVCKTLDLDVPSNILLILDSATVKIPDMPQPKDLKEPEAPGQK